jgi:hypothetical protein
MVITFLKDKTDSIRFAFISANLAFILGIIFYLIPRASEHIYFFVSAPIATFFSCYYIWMWTFKTTKDYKIANVVMAGLLLTVICHFLNFVLLGFGRSISNFLTGNYTLETESFLGTLTYFSFIRTLVSLYTFGVFTWIMFTMTGIYVMKTSKSVKKNDPIL